MIHVGQTRLFNLILYLNCIKYQNCLKLSEISTDDIQEFFNQKDDSGYKESTIHKMDIVIKQIFHSAIEDGELEKNPAQSKRLKYNSQKDEREA